MRKDLTIAVRDYVELDRKVVDYRKDDLSQFTRRLYAEQWQTFTNFIAPKDVWNATPMDVARWMVSKALRGVTPHTILRDKGGLNYYFEQMGKGAAHGRPGVGTRPSPARDPLVKQTMRGIHRRHGQPYKRKKPLLLDSLEKMIDHQDDSMAGIRNRAMFVIGWGAALRVNEIRMLDIRQQEDSEAWVEVRDDGLLVSLRRSKANRFGRTLEEYAVPARPGAPRYCPVRLVREWLLVSAAKKGPLFVDCRGRYTIRRVRLNRNSIRTAVKTHAARIGIDPAGIGGNSLRRGCLTWLRRQKVDPLGIQKQSGHRDLRSLLDYIEEPVTVTDSPLAHTLWAL